MGIGLEPFYVECKTEVHLLGPDASLLVGVDGGQRQLDAGMVFRDVVSSVHQVVGHDVEEVQGCVNGRHVGFRERQHVSGESRYGGRDELFGTQGRANL